VGAAEKNQLFAHKWLMHATVIHIPILLGLMVYDKIARVISGSTRSTYKCFSSHAALNATLNGTSAILLAGGYARDTSRQNRGTQTLHVLGVLWCRARS